MQIKELSAPHLHPIIKKKAYLTKGRTGREGSSLKILGGVAMAVGVIWTAEGLIAAGGMSGLGCAIGTLLAGAILFWTGLGVAKTA